MTTHNPSSFGMEELTLLITIIAIMGTVIWALHHDK